MHHKDGELCPGGYPRPLGCVPSSASSTAELLLRADALVRRAIRNCGRYGRQRIRWCVVSELFGVPAYDAQDLCRQYGFDPHYMVGRPRNEEDD